MIRLSTSFYDRDDVVLIAREAIGKFLVTQIDGKVTSGMITETEAYAGIGDRASHAYGDRRTRRTGVMYARGGTAYVYLCYGIHSLFNFVTSSSGTPHAVLVRGIMPAEGTGTMLQRAGRQRLLPADVSGPGRVSKLLGIHHTHSGLDLTTGPAGSGPAIWLEDRGIQINPDDILAGPRIGVGYAGEDALLPYRFLFKTTDGMKKK